MNQNKYFSILEESYSGCSYEELLNTLLEKDRVIQYFAKISFESQKKLKEKDEMINKLINLVASQPLDGMLKAVLAGKELAKRENSK